MDLETNDLMENYLRDLNGYNTLKRCKFRTKKKRPAKSEGWISSK